MTDSPAGNDNSPSPDPAAQPDSAAQPQPQTRTEPASNTSDMNSRVWMISITVGTIVGLLAFTGALAGGILASYAPSYNSPEPAATQENPDDPGEPGEPGDPGDPVAPEPAPVDPAPEPPMPAPPMPEPPIATVPPPGWDDVPGWDDTGDAPTWDEAPNPSDMSDAANPAAYIAAAREINAAQEDVNIVTMALDDIGFDYRIVAIDGDYLPVTQDYSNTRLNLEIMDGIVVSASVG